VQPESHNQPRLYLVIETQQPTQADVAAVATQERRGVEAGCGRLEGFLRRRRGYKVFDSTSGDTSYLMPRPLQIRCRSYSTRPTPDATCSTAFWCRDNPAMSQPVIPQTADSVSGMNTKKALCLSHAAHIQTTTYGRNIRSTHLATAAVKYFLDLCVQATDHVVQRSISYHQRRYMRHHCWPFLLQLQARRARSVVAHAGSFHRQVRAPASATAPRFRC
jgi:hypothetical protein